MKHALDETTILAEHLESETMASKVVEVVGMVVGYIHASAEA